MRGNSLRHDERDRLQYEQAQPDREAQIMANPRIAEDVRRTMAEYLELPTTPSVQDARDLLIIGLPELCGANRILDVSIARGQPENGAMRSDDHVSRFEVEFPIHEWAGEEPIGVFPDPDDLHGVRVCPECGSERAVYAYSACHFIAGSEDVSCAGCGTTLYHEDWS